MPLGTNSVFLVSYETTFASQRYLFTQTFRIVNSDSDQTPALDTFDLVQHFIGTGANDLLTRYRACLASNAIVIGCTVQGIYPIRFVRSSATLNLVGTQSNQANTGNIAGVVTLRTHLAGRSQVANKHVGPAAVDMFEAGAAVAAERTALLNLGNRITENIVVDLSTAGQEISYIGCIYHKASQTNDLVVTAVASDRAGTMRRRTLRVGQ